MKGTMKLLLALPALFFSSTLLAGKVVEQFTVKERQLEQKKLAIFKELAEAGASSAYIALARIGEKRALITPPSQDQIFDWYVAAAQTGNSYALIWLGHFFLHGPGSSEKDSVKNGLELLTSAAVLGDLRAVDDLVLIPKILRVSYDQVEDAFHESINNLSSGQVIDCSWIKCNPELSKTLTSAIIKAEIFRNNWQQSKIARIDKYIRLIGVEKLLAQSNDLSKLITENQIQNSGKIDKNLRLKAQEQLKENPDWEQETYLDRVNNRQSSAAIILQHYNNQDLLSLEENIRHALGLINFHRDPSAHISYDEILKIIKTNP